MRINTHREHSVKIAAPQEGALSCDIFNWSH